ncbi:MAG: hypothetical protein RSA51_07315 [Niameybacter sp.]
MAEEMLHIEDVRSKDMSEVLRTAFAKVGNKQVTFDFNKVLKTTNGKFTREQIVSALENNSLEQLIQISRYYYIKSGLYKQMLHRFAGIHFYRWKTTPKLNGKRTNLKTAHTKVATYATNAKIEDTCLEIALKCLIDGTAYTYENVMSDDQVSTQFLPSEYCRTREYDVYGNKVVQMNMEYFDKYDNVERDTLFKALPSEFKKAYNTYKSGDKGAKDPKWQTLSPEFARATSFSIDDSPYFASIFPDLYDYEEYKQMNKTASRIDLVKVFVQKVPIDKATNELIFDDELIDTLHNNISNVAKNSGAGALTTPCEVEALSIGNKEEKKMDYVATGLTGVYNESSMPEVVFNSSSKNSGSSGINSSNRMTEGIFSIILGQFARWYSKRFDLVAGGKLKWNVEFLDVTRLNEKDKTTIAKDQFVAGGSAIYYFSSIGVNQFELDNALEYEDFLGIKDKLRPPLTSYTATSDDVGGAPEKSDNEVSDEQVKQRNNGTGENRTSSEG